jgi:hypothetical protein
MKKYIFYITVLALIVSACDLKEDYEVERSATNPINGEFYATLDLLDGTEWVEDVYSLGYVTLKITNTSADDADMVWFDDGENWPTKAKIKCNPTTGTFEPGTFNANYAVQTLAKEDTTSTGEFVIDVFKEDHPIEYSEVSIDRHVDKKDSVLVSGYGLTVKVLGGKIEKGTFEAPSKAMTDKISIELEWSDDPGTTYRYNGYRRTGFLEDEH